MDPEEQGCVQKPKMGRRRWSWHPTPNAAGAVAAGPRWHLQPGNLPSPELEGWERGREGRQAETKMKDTVFNDLIL